MKNSVRFVGAELWAWARGRRRRVVVGGRSMLPTLEPGDFVLIDPTPGLVSDGSIVVAHHPEDRGLLVVKRCRIVAEGLWLTSDNQGEGSDSARFGPVAADAILGRVTMLLDHPRRRLE